MVAPSGTAIPAVSQKWLPVIARDACVGCNRCIVACPPLALEMIWDFVTLVRPADCDSCELCAQICPHGVIHMDWCRRSSQDVE